MVAPLAGAWIEITAVAAAVEAAVVAPLAGAWIEINFRPRKRRKYVVAPLAGAWIEMPASQAITRASMSRPSRARGLK